MWVLREGITQFLFDHRLVFIDQTTPVFRSQFRIQKDIAAILVIFQKVFKHVMIDTQDDVAVHLQKTTVAIIGKTFIAGCLCQAFDRFVVQTQIKDGVHHSRHGSPRARTNRHKQGVSGFAKFQAHDLFNTGQGVKHLFLQAIRIGLIVGRVVSANFRRQRETGWDGKSKGTHLGKVCAFAAQQILHRGVAVRLAVSERINPLSHFSQSSAFNFREIRDSTHYRSDF